MDIDASQPSTSAEHGTMSKLEEGANVEMLRRLEAISASPYDFDLHMANVKAAKTSDEREEARAFMSSMLALPEELWIDWIQEKLDQPDPTLETSIEILELYKRACQDSLSIRLHTDYATYVVSLFYKARGLMIPDASEDDEMLPDESLADAVAAGVFTEEFVRDELESAISPVVRYHLTEGQRVWLVQHNFELDRLKKTRSPQAVEYMHQFYLKRLSEPHLQILDTHQMFSTFVSTHLAEDYEGSMVSAQKVLNGSQKLVGPRESKEDQLAKSKYNSQAFGYYIEWELQVKHPHVGLVRTLYERAIAMHPHESSLWTGYADFLKQAYSKGAGKAAGSDLKVEEEDVVNVCNRIARSIPASGQGAASAIRVMESLPDAEQANAFSDSQLARALETSTLDGRLEDYVELVTACADMARHRVDSLGENDESQTDHIDILNRSIEKLKSLTKDVGDPLFRLEKYLIRAYEQAGRYDQAETLFDKLLKQYSSSSSLVLLRVDFEIKRGDIHCARKHFIAATKRRIDYPEYTYEAWIAFEHREGSLENLQKALETVKHEMKFVLARRQKEAAKQAKAEALAASMEPSSNITAAPVMAEDATASPATQSVGNKRAASEGISSEGAPSMPASKKVKPNEDETAATEVKRDRENATILVSQLPPETSEAELKNLFRDCGRIREVKIKQFDSQTVATIEFISKDAVPAAITKDKKRIGASHEISVVPDWHSTLYITNFPETYKMEDLQALFTPFGAIFDTRWPSKRFKSTRRFAYVQFVSPTSAEAALRLHNTQPEEGSEQRMQVKLSDPTRAVARTDANANRREIYVTGLSRYTTADDLKKLFKDFGTIKGARVGQDEQGNCKGFGFVDFENESEAASALSMNNKEYKKKRLAVVLADSKVTAKTRHPDSGLGKQSDTRLRSIRVTKLPTTAQEPIIQQIFEKFGEIEAVLTEEAGEAVVVFKDTADAGRLLLHAEPILYEGETLKIAEERPRTGAQASPAVRGRGGASSAFLPRSGRGRGRGTKLGIGAVSSSARKGAGAKPVETAPLVTSESSARSEAGVRSQSDFRALLSK